MCKVGRQDEAAGSLEGRGDCSKIATCRGCKQSNHSPRLRKERHGGIPTTPWEMTKCSEAGLERVCAWARKERCHWLLNFPGPPVTALWRSTYYSELQARQGPTGRLDELSYLMLRKVCWGT